MRKLLLLFSFLAFYNANSQFYEDFDALTTFPPPGWLVTDNGVGTINWDFNVPIANFQINNTNCAFMNRQNIGAGNTSQDWLIMPAISINTDDALLFLTKQGIAGTQFTTFQIMASTGAQNDLSGYTTIANWNEIELNPVYNQPTQMLVSLNEFAGQSTHIAFVRTYTQPTASLSGDRWLVDNVSVGPAVHVSGTVSYSDSPDCTNGIGIPNIQVEGVGDQQQITVFTDADGNYTFYMPGTSATVTTELSETISQLCRRVTILN
ncbi:MAG: hypothetical protein EOO50_10425 [Flavobacterium sp.]|uniref:choice-of-anchor J domain-containing protein n=1 Tax=Flavobacterium sp. TaxID=239 RepID=UPI001205933D|nr:choice-of-anchor J domain-containing protein [Flavobacterium sp.]RZJ66338.1 MAG: hypothetical protein EOO50_10425 [Flavobacterium sp.]